MKKASQGGLDHLVNDITSFLGNDETNEMGVSKNKNEKTINSAKDQNDITTLES